MGEGLGKTGIDILSDSLRGTHLCHFSQTKNDLVDILVPYFKTQLGDNQSCGWVTSSPLLARKANNRTLLTRGDVNSAVREQNNGL